MRAAVSLLVLALLIGCAPEAPVDADAACSAQGYAPDTDAWQACTNAGGATIATGPGSPYWLAREAYD